MENEIQGKFPAQGRHMFPLMKKCAKYGSVGTVTIRNHLAYVYDFVIRSLFLLVILFIFMQLWRVTFAGEGGSSISGYSYEQIIWYLIFAESIILASPKLTVTVEEEVKKGDIGYKLTKPVSYVLFHYVSYMGEALVRVVVNLVMGGLLGLLVFGWDSLRLGFFGFFIVVLGSFTVNFLLTMMLALCAFWVEETRGLDFVYNKLLFTIGGMMLPLEIFPDTLRQICSWLPFQTIVYFSAKAAVHFDWETVARMVGIQLLWIAILSCLLTLVYRKGVTKLNVNGG